MMKQKGYSPIKSGFAPLLIVLIIAVLGAGGFFAYKNRGSILKPIRPTPMVTPTPTPGQGKEGNEKINCKDPRPEVCTMECIQNPPYICGSDGKSYCSVCQACSNKGVTWYEMKNSPCEGQLCGGFGGISCPEGYECQLEGSYPDASGVCTKK